MITLTRPEIEALIHLPDAARAIEDAYIATSRGQVTLPPVGHITFANYQADCHIKYGHIHGDPTFVIKVATGFPMNAAKGLPTGGGVVLVLSAETGEMRAMLHDEMMLTDIRTGIGGAIVSRTLARPDATRVLVIGTGPQAQQQINAHRALLPQDLSFAVWGRNAVRAATLAVDDVTPVQDLQSAVRQAQIIVTATGSTAPYLQSDWVQPGTHITAVGADAPGKQELDMALIARADVLAVDLIAQCVDHGEVSHAISAGLVNAAQLVEVGALLADPTLGRKTPDQITIADLTGIAAQDIAIANCVLRAAT